MHQKEDLVARAEPALADPNARRVLMSLLAMYGEAGVVGAVNKVTQALKIEHAMAASLRYGATLARDYPETFQQLIQNDNHESEKIMSDQQVLTAREYVYTGRRFFFMWGDWPCELTVPQDQTSYKNNCIRDRARINAKGDCNFFGDLTGFSAIISFPPRTIGELEARLDTMAQVGDQFILDGSRVRSFLEFADDHDHPDQRIGGREGIHALWLAIQGNKSTTPFFKFHEVELSRLKIGFRFGHHYMPDENLDLLYDDTFRTDLMLAHLRHYFGIPTEPINYAPAPKEEVVAKSEEPELVRVTDAQMGALFQIMGEMDDRNSLAQRAVRKLFEATDNLAHPVWTQFIAGDQRDAFLKGLRILLTCNGGAGINSVLQAMGSPLQFTFESRGLAGERGVPFITNVWIAQPGKESEAIVQEFTV